MAVNKKDLLEAMKDPDLLKSAGLQPITDRDEEELFSDIEVGDDDTMQDVVRKMNERSKKQLAFMKKRETAVLAAAKEDAGKPEQDRKQAEVNSFLKKHPELSSNRDLLDIVEPLYNNGMTLDQAYKNGCKVLDLSPETGKAPGKDDAGTKKEEQAKDSTKTPAFKSDTSSSKGPEKAVASEGGDKAPKTIREIASEQANSLAANGNNPFRD